LNCHAQILEKIEGKMHIKIPIQIRKISLTVWIFVGLVLGVISGLTLKTAILPLANLMGEIFLRLLKMVIVPLIFTSITSGVLSIGGAQNLGRLTLKTFLYYIMTSLIAILTGLWLVNWFKPGVGANLNLTEKVAVANLSSTSLKDIFIRMIPENPVAAMAQGEVLPLIFFALLCGLFIGKIADNHARTLSGIVNAGCELMMRITHGVILLAPLGVFGLVARICATTGLLVFKSLGYYFLTVATGLMLHFWLTLPLIILIFSRCHPYRHLQNMGPALLTAFTTASSSATLPITMAAAEKRAGISNKIASFVLPLGATINMDGTALYECVAAIFIAQVYGIELGFVSQFIIVFTSLLASIGAAGIPMAGLVMMAIVLKSVGLPLEGIGMILAVDQVLDMLRTSVNVWSDSCGALIIARSEGELNVVCR